MSVFAERLVTQMMLLREKAAEVELCQTQLQDKLQYEAQTQQAVDQLREQVQKLEELRRTLDKLNEAAKEGCERVRQEEQTRTQELQATLNVRIMELAERAEQLAAAEKKARQENTTMQAHLEIYAQHEASSSEKLEELLRQRDEQLKQAEKKGKSDAARIPQMQALLDEETTLLEAATQARDGVKAKVEEYVARFDSIQAQLMRSKEAYEAAKEERERYQRTLNALDGDRQVILTRVKRSAAERNAAYDKMRALQEQVEAMRKQTEKIVAVADMLEKPTTTSVSTP